MKKGETMEIYTVRKSANDIKSQKGAFFMLENAIKIATKTRCNVYDSNKNCVWNKHKGGEIYEQSI